MSHTPGPWIAHDRIIDAPDGAVAVVNLARPNNDAHADARLIAAAPDLLVACRAVAGVFQDSSDPPLYAQKCIAAIAKATGEA